MEHQDHLFQPESVNEQVEDLLRIQNGQQQQATPGGPTMAALEDMYREDEGILERAWLRIVSAEVRAIRPTSDDAIRSIEKQQLQGERQMQKRAIPLEGDPLISRPSSGMKKQRHAHRMWSMIGLAAAMLLVLTNVLVFRYLGQPHHPQSRAGSGTITSRPPLGTTFSTHTFPQQRKDDDDRDIAINMLAWSPSGQRLAVAAGPLRHGSISIWDALTGAHEMVLTPPPSKNQYCDSDVYATEVAWSPDGTRLASAIGDIQIWNPTTGQVMARYFPNVSSLSAVTQVAWSPDGRYLAGGYNEANGTAGVTIWDVRTGLVVQTFADRDIDEISWSPNGKYFAVSSDDPTQITDPRKTVIWKTSNWQSVLTLKGLEVRGTPWSPDSTLLALVNPSGVGIQIVSIPEKKVILTYTGQNNEYSRSISWSPNGKRLVSAGTKTIQIWNSATGQHLFTYTGQFGTTEGNPNLGALNWSPDGKYVASSTQFEPNFGGGGTIKVWQAE